MEQAATSYIAQNNQKVVLTIKYKIYIVILVILMAFGRGYMNDTVDRHNTTKDNVVGLEKLKTQKEAEYQQVIKDLIVIKDVNAQKSAVLSCLSTKGCITLPETIAPVSNQVRAFLQLQKNEGQKMAYDQKKILANINEYLLRGANGASNGIVTSILFGNLAPVVENDNVMQIPISLSVDFADKNGLLSFVYNVENTISPQFPMLYKLSSVNYDIVKYQETQTVTIELVGYMIK